nr:MAG TPA: hypothetical protein [Caudoviricetes sp.]DAS32623.1 MAG TPA: hypothetical protein [Caudoviricetes sp.]
MNSKLVNNKITMRRAITALLISLCLNMMTL